MTQFFGIDWLAMCLTFSAIDLLGNKRRSGFVIMLLANLGFFAMNVRGFAKWSPAASVVKA